MKHPELVIKKFDKVAVFSVSGRQDVDIVPALPFRPWMDRLEASDKWLPATIANQAGWIIVNREEIEVVWNGGESPSDVQISSRNPATSLSFVSQAGSGIVTWKLPLLFRLPPELNLRLRGPTNWYKEGAFPIEQVLDVDSSVSAVSMSWKVTKVGIPIRFEVGEPLCMIYPELRGLADEVDPEMRSIDEDPILKEHVRLPLETGTTSQPPNSQKKEQEGGGEAKPIFSPLTNLSGTRIQLKDRELGSQSQQSEIQKIEALSPRTDGLSRNRPASPNPNFGLEPFRIENDFYDQAAALRDQFERVASQASIDPSSDALLFTYAEDVYQFVSANATRVFSADLLFGFLDRLRSWAGKELGAMHASTPRVQIYIRGSHRNFAKDDIRARWHYLLSLTRNKKQAKRVNILLESASAKTDGTRLRLNQVARVALDFNELLVHDARGAYGIEQVKEPTNPVGGVVLLEGYLW
jgi:Family of unknown function (DUF6065)